MYQPKKYKKSNPEYFFSFIKEHPFATLVVQGKRFLATHIPVLVEGEPTNFKLYAHIANFNEMLPFLKDEAEVLIIFQGANGYVSSSWYEEKDISTWDYSAVHVNAKIKLQTKEELETSLDKLVHRFESDQENPLFYKDLPKEMLEDNLPLITGFWCEPFKMEGVAKLHQSYKKEDVVSTIKHLESKHCPMTKQLSEDISKENNLT